MNHTKGFDNYYKNKDSFSDGRFIQYAFSHDNANKKIVYVRWIEEWGWAVGSGFNLDKINDKIIQRQKHLEEKYNQYLQETIILSALLIFALLIVSHIISRYVEKSFYNYKSSLEEKHKTLVKAQKTASIGDWKLDIETKEAYWSDEILNIFGVEEVNEKIGPSFLQKLMHPDDWETFINSLENTIHNKNDHACIYRVISPKDDAFSEFNIKDIIFRTLNLIDVQFKSNNITIVQDTQDFNIVTLENELVQALINILNNARDALLNTNDVKEKLILIKTNVKNNKLIIEIQDNAGGIPSHIINRVFEPYFTTKHQTHGTGIGLYMTQQIVNKLLSGLIKVQNKEFTYGSKKYYGANFKIILSLKK